MDLKSHNPLHEASLSVALEHLTHLNLTEFTQYDELDAHAHGGFCDIYKGTIKRENIPEFGYIYSSLPEVNVSVKRLRAHIKKDTKLVKAFTKELKIWSKLKHENILQLFGYVIRGNYPSFISEWMENGTASQYVKTQQPNINSIHRLATGIASGLEYLHGKNIIHSDLKAANILISPSDDPLICDFGISHLIQATMTGGQIASDTTKGVGSLRWMAPELFDLEGSMAHTKESDIWAYGMTIYELLTGSIPYGNILIEPVVMFAIIQGKLPSQEESQLASENTWARVRLLELCKLCWASNPRERVTIRSILESLYKSRPPQINAPPAFPLFEPGIEEETSKGGKRKTRRTIRTKSTKRMVSVTLESESIDPEPPIKRLRDMPIAGSSITSPGWEIISTRSQHSSFPQDTDANILDGLLCSLKPANRKIRRRARGRGGNTPVIRSINRLIASSHYIQFDFSRPSPSILAARGNWQLEPGKALETDCLQGPATNPPIKEMRVSCNSFGKFEGAWFVDVKPGRTITVIDVLSSVYTLMQTPISDHEWDSMNQTEKCYASESYSCRVRSNRLDYESLRGVLRVDFLHGAHFFDRILYRGEIVPNIRDFKLITHV